MNQSEISKYLKLVASLKANSTLIGVELKEAEIMEKLTHSINHKQAKNLFLAYYESEIKRGINTACRLL